MNNNLPINTIKIRNYAGDEIPEWLLMQYGGLRYLCFDPDDPNVNMDRERRVEFDHFDRRPYLRYIMITVEEEPGREKLICGMRLMPTHYDYELQMKSWRYLTTGCELPKSDRIVESGRWVGLGRSSRHGPLFSGLMNRELHTWAVEEGYDTCLGVIHTRFESWFVDEGVNVLRDSSPYTLPTGGDIVMVRIMLDEYYQELANRQIMQGVGSARLSEISLNVPLAA